MPPRQDDPTIRDDELLWRRILPEWVHVNPDGSTRPSSVAFIDRRSGEVSVHRAELTDLDLVRAVRPTDSVVEVTAGFVRSLGCIIAADPKPDDPSHALICPSPSKAIARKLAEHARWIIQPPSGS